MFCGETSQPVNTSDSFGYVKFRSNGAVQSPGVQIRYQASVEGKKDPKRDNGAASVKSGHVHDCGVLFSIFVKY